MVEFDFGSTESKKMARMLKAQMRPEVSGAKVFPVPDLFEGGSERNIRPEISRSAPTNIRAAFSLNEGQGVQNG